MAAFWKRKKRPAPKPAAAPTGTAKSESSTSPPRKKRLVPLETKLLAMRALESGMVGRDVAELAGVSGSTVEKWKRAYRKDGVDGLSRRPMSSEARKLAEAIEQRIVEHRQEHPEHGVRRIRDELRRQDAVEVSAETVRRVVNDAGLGQAPPQAKRRPPQVRRFERELPNAMWPMGSPALWGARALRRSPRGHRAAEIST